MDFPSYRMPPPPILTTFSRESLGDQVVLSVTSGPSSSTWLVANKAYYFPFFLSDFATAYQLLFPVGATSSGNIDMGIYDSAGNKIVSSGSTAMSATVNTVQELNITDTALPPGNYYLAVAVDNTTGTWIRTTLSDEFAGAAIVYQQTSAFALPTTATFAVASDATLQIGMAGIQFRSSPF